MSKFLVISIIVAIVIFFIMKNKTPTVSADTETIPETTVIELVDTPILNVSNDIDEDFVPENLPTITENFPEVIPEIPEIPEVIPEIIPDPVKVSKIIISKASSVNKVLTIAEVRLFNNGVQVSLKGGKASQSSTENNNSLYGASKAIDGLNKFNLAGNSVTFTELGKNHWWRVLFSNHVDATEIKIYNNKDGLAHLTGSILKVFDENNQIILQKTLSRNAIQTHSLI